MSKNSVDEIISSYLKGDVASVSAGKCSYPLCNTVEPKECKKCTQCMKSAYCKKECQINDWQEHKKICNPISPLESKVPAITKALMQNALEKQELEKKEGFKEIRQHFKYLNGNSEMRQRLLNDAQEDMKKYGRGALKIHLNPIPDANLTNITNSTNSTNNANKESKNRKEKRILKREKLLKDKKDKKKNIEKNNTANADNIKVKKSLYYTYLPSKHEIFSSGASKVSKELENLQNLMKIYNPDTEFILFAHYTLSNDQTVALYEVFKL